MRRSGLLLAGIFLALGLWGGDAALALRYTIRDLGTLGGGNSEARDVNAFAQVVGFSELPNSSHNTHAFLFTGGAMIDLGTLGGAESRALGVNDLGQVAGQAKTAAGQDHAFLWTAGSMLDLGVLAGATSSEALAINNLGQVVGTSGNKAFLWEEGSMIDLNTRIPGGSGWVLEKGTAVNDLGQITGNGKLNSLDRAFLLNPSAGNYTVSELGTLSGSEARAWGLNNQGDVVGRSRIAQGGEYAYLYVGGVMTSLGVAGDAYGVNSAQRVVGATGGSAFIYTPDNGVVMLGSSLLPGSGWTLAAAWAINEAGQIVGRGQYGSQPHAYLMTPKLIDCPNEFSFEFSLDIGSDSELSDPNVDLDEGFDPGDIYFNPSPPVGPPTMPGGWDGFGDDQFVFQFEDPWPEAPDPAPPFSAVPVGHPLIGPDWYDIFFDLDAHDQADFSLREMVPADAALGSPIPQFETTCVFEVRYLALSYDDDQAAGWPAADVPVDTASVGGAGSYGTTAAKDEIIGLTLSRSSPPFVVDRVYPVADEAGVHPDLAPNPDGTEEDDDDVDSLDAQALARSCDVLLFSVDHEASFGLDPGSVYQATGVSPPVRVIDQVIHLGLADDPGTTEVVEDADIDALELAWVNASGVGMSLALLFSVDDDDPLTPDVDESGGLDPRMLYYSFMNGVSHPLLAGTSPLSDDVDALTLFCQPLDGSEPSPNGPPPDFDRDGDVDQEDFAQWQQCTTLPGAGYLTGCSFADLDLDGDVDTDDLTVLIDCRSGPHIPAEPTCAD